MCEYNLVKPISELTDEEIKELSRKLKDEAVHRQREAYAEKYLSAVKKSMDEALVMSLFNRINVYGTYCNAQGEALQFDTEIRKVDFQNNRLKIYLETIFEE